MCCNKFLSVGILVILALFLGCSKGKNTAAKKTGGVPEISKTLSSTADTADIFKEFYSEDTAKKSPAGKTTGKTRKTAGKNETFSPASAASASSADFSENGRYVVQVSCVKSQSFADKMAGGLKDKGYPAYVAEVQNPTPSLSGTFYRIRIGAFKVFSAAKAFGENTLSPNGFQYWVDKKSNDKVGMEGYGLGAGPAAGNATSSYENAPTPASTWSGSSTSADQGQSSGSSSTVSPSPASSSSSPAVPEAPAPAKAASPAAPAPSGASSASPAPSSATSAPSKATQPSTAPSAAAQSSSAPSTASQTSSAPSAAKQPTSATSSTTPPSSSTTGGSKSSSGGSSDWGTDSSAAGSGW